MIDMSLRAWPSWVPLSPSVAVVSMVLGMFSTTMASLACMGSSAVATMPWSFTWKSRMRALLSPSTSSMT